jgi:hypothetical protein
MFVQNCSTVFESHDSNLERPASIEWSRQLTGVPPCQCFQSLWPKWTLYYAREKQVVVFRSLCRIVGCIAGDPSISVGAMSGNRLLESQSPTMTGLMMPVCGFSVAAVGHVPVCKRQLGWFVSVPCTFAKPVHPPHLVCRKAVFSIEVEHAESMCCLNNAQVWGL